MSPTKSESGRVVLGLAAEDCLRFGAVDLTAVVEFARTRLDLSPLAAVALGRCAAGAALLQPLATKRALVLGVDLRGPGPLKRVFSEIDEQGRIRGLVGDPQCSLGLEEHGEIRLAEALGAGLLRVNRQEEGGTNYESQVALLSGEVGADIAHYLEQSEQRQSAVSLGVLVRPTGVTSAAGLIVEALPGTPQSTVALVERNLARIPSVSRLMETEGLDEVVKLALEGLSPRVLSEHPVRYECRCSREKLGGNLAGLSLQDLDSLTVGDGQLDAECAYCGEIYTFTREELESIRPQAPN